VVGLDPDPERLWPPAIELVESSTVRGPGRQGPAGRRADAGTPAGRAARAVQAHCALVLEAVAEHCVAAKLQLACFERLGAPGWAALAATVEHARQRGLLVIADGKRGDIDVSARAYGQAFFAATQTPFGEVGGLGADALTVSPLLGTDSLAPLLALARARGGGLFVLVRTSNPGGAELQELALADGGTLSERLATMVSELQGPGELGDVGAVVGATAPGRLQRLRELMPSAPFLLPGVGAQGGRVEDLGPAFAPGRAGGLVAASRAIVDAFRVDGGDPAAAATAAAARLRERAWQLAR
jgi:orotidine-5'-phosphate decarboxylase